LDKGVLVYPGLGAAAAEGSYRFASYSSFFLQGRAWESGRGKSIDVTKETLDIAVESCIDVDLSGHSMTVPRLSSGSNGRNTYFDGRSAEEPEPRSTNLVQDLRAVQQKLSVAVLT
jgi:hypothetical protein